jgi:Zn-dependent protease
MIKPAVVSPGEAVTTVGRVFDAPLVTKGYTWLPLAELVTWLIMVREAGRLHPERNWWQRMGVAAMTMPAILGSEWCHNLAHAAAAKYVGHPVDVIRISWGMPLLVYFDEEDPRVTPQQHIIRALGGPVLNLIFLSAAAVLRPFTRSTSTARDLVDAAFWMNTFLVLGGMLPIPYVDGGAVIRWALRSKGFTPNETDTALKKINAITAAGLAAGAAAAFKKHKPFLGGIFALFAGTTLLIASGLLREK